MYIINKVLSMYIYILKENAIMSNDHRKQYSKSNSANVANEL